MPDRRWKLWATVAIGPSPDQLTELSLVLASAEELGVLREAPYEEICRRGTEAGLQLCPREVFLALSIEDFPLEKHKWHILALSSIHNVKGSIIVSYLMAEGDSQSIRTHPCPDDTPWHYFDLFIFVCPKELLE